MIYPSVAVSFLHEIMLVAQPSDNPTNQDWDSLLTSIKATRNRPPRAVIISSDGGSPSATQRKKLRETLQNLQTTKETSPPMAMLTDVTIVRVGLTALRVFIHNAPVAFSTKQWREVAAHLRLSWEESVAAAGALNELRASINLPPLPAPK